MFKIKKCYIFNHIFLNIYKYLMYAKIYGICLSDPWLFELEIFHSDHYSSY